MWPGGAPEVLGEGRGLLHPVSFPCGWETSYRHQLGAQALPLRERESWVVAPALTVALFCGSQCGVHVYTVRAEPAHRGGPGGDRWVCPWRPGCQLSH